MMRPTVASETAETVPAELHEDLGAAPHGLLEAPLLDGLDEIGCPAGLACRLRPAGPPARILGPAVEGRDGMADGLGGLLCRQAISPRLLPAGDRVSPLRFVAALRRFETRRQTGTAIYRAVQTTNLHGDLRWLRLPDPSLGDLRFALLRASHMCLSADIAGAGGGSAGCERSLDRLGQLRRSRLHPRCIAGDQAAIASDEILVEVPARTAGAAHCTERPAVEGVCLRP